MAGCPVATWVGVSVMGRVMGSIPAVGGFNPTMLGKKTAPVNHLDSGPERGLEMAGQTV
jgi:hypothetical protein